MFTCTVDSANSPLHSNQLAILIRLRERISRLVIRLSTAKGVFAVLLGLVATIAATECAKAQTYTVLYSFRGFGMSPYGGLTRDSKGNLYGASRGGGGGYGQVFKLDTNGKESAVWSSSGGAAGIYPFGGVVFANEFLYATTSLGGCGVLFKLGLNGSTTILHDFNQKTDGCVPQADLVRDAAGTIYGTTASGGSFGFGTVYKIDGSGNYTELHSFAGPPTDGRSPSPGALALDEAGNLAGSTVSGGTNNCGVIFSLDPKGKETILHNFTGGADGKNPHGSLARTATGMLVGAVSYGGTNRSCSGGCGLVFGVDTTGKAVVLHTFDFSTDGGLPSGGLVRDEAGNLYGTTTEGGPSGYGVVFKLDPKGKVTVLHSFHNTDGSVPFGTLLRDPAGNLYGSTLYGGAHVFGVIFKVKQ